MKVVGEIKEEKYLTIKDLEPGEVFIFKDCDSPMILSKDEQELFLVVNLVTGEAMDAWVNRLTTKPIRKLNAYLIIEDEED